MKKLVSLSVLTLSALLLLSGCGEKSVQPTRIDGSGSAGDGEVSLCLPIPKALAEVVARVEAVVSANDMETITQDLTIDENGNARGIIRNVPAGLARIVTLNAYDAGGTLIYTGSSRVDVITGQTAQVKIILREMSPSGPFFVYVVNSQSGTVSVINGNLNEVIFSIARLNAAKEIAIATRDNIAWVIRGTWVSAVDLEAKTIATSFNTPYYNDCISLSPDGTAIYMGGGDGNWYCSLLGYSTSDYTEIMRVKHHGFGIFTGIAFSPDGGLIYAIYPREKEIEIYDISNQLIGEIDVGTHPYQPAITPDNTFAYVTNNASNTVSVIDLTSYEVMATIPVGNGPMGIAIK